MGSTAFGNEAHVMLSIEAGAAGYLLRDNSPANMMNEIRSLNGGGSPISPLIARQILTRFRRVGAVMPVSAAEPAAAVLSAREQHVLGLITKGYTTEECAALMQGEDGEVYAALGYVRKAHRASGRPRNRPQVTAAQPNEAA